MPALLATRTRVDQVVRAGVAAQQPRQHTPPLQQGAALLIPLPRLMFPPLQYGILEDADLFCVKIEHNV